ncbi:hypothetical protein M9Y10_008776 [Tritrichomonas musculus]|uniref:Leucine-rich repeat domain-containing protein n=1 Tax=Tritrichomonas musculus TaxID=1915356 RepID=A0ABR2J074_9EUKA
MSRSRSDKEVILEYIKYSINEEEKTANVIRCQDNISEIIIPRSIKYESNEYVVTTISNGAFGYSNVRSISFEPNSELRTIERNALYDSTLARLQIPASAIELEDGWCIGTKDLSHVEVEPGNARYSSFDGKCIIGKSDITQEDYDTLVFWVRDTLEANIPPTIKIIGPYAFSGSKIESIVIPSHITKICKRAFSECNQLFQIEFEPNSELRTIEKEAFYNSALAGIRIPSNTVELKDGWCFGTYYLSNVEVEQGNARYSSVDGKCIIGKSDIAQEDYDTLVFWVRDTLEANIPPTIKIIGPYAFAGSLIVSIVIPSLFTKICERAFYECEQLFQIEFEPNSELQIIEKEAFSHSALERILIPSHVTKICERAFSYCDLLFRVEFEPNSELRSIEKEVFFFGKLTSLLIPCSVTHISDDAFSLCEGLKIVEIEENSVDEGISMSTFRSEIIMLPVKKRSFSKE